MNSIFESLSESEIKKLINDRLLSNMLGRDFTFDFYDSTTNSIILIHDPCGNAIVTTMSAIEDGDVSCQYCKLEEIRKNTKNKVEKIRRLHDFKLDIAAMHLQVIPKNNNLFLTCQRCGESQIITNEMLASPYRDSFSCPSIDCTIENLLGKYFSHEVLDDDNYAVDDFCEDIFKRFDGNSGHTKLTCKECNKHFVIANYEIPLWDSCPYCIYSDVLEEAKVSLDNYDMASDTVSLTCKECNTRFYITTAQVESEEFDCPVCYQTERARIDINTPIEKLPIKQNTMFLLAACGIKTFGDISPESLHYLCHESDSARKDILNILAKYL